MDIATLAGLVMGIFVIAGSILVAGASFGAFIDYPSVVCVVGGCIAAVLICVPLRTFLSIGKVSMKVMMNKPSSVSELIQTLVGLAETARRDGLLALEGRLSDVKDPF